MTRLLYNINEWFNNLQIHQQIIYALAAITPMIAGIMVGTFWVSVSGCIVYFTAQWVRSKGDKIRREAHEILSYYDQKFWGTCHKDKVLIGLIMLEKRFDKNSSHGKNIRV